MGYGKLTSLTTRAGDPKRVSATHGCRAHKSSLKAPTPKPTGRPEVAAETDRNDAGAYPHWSAGGMRVCATLTRRSAFRQLEIFPVRTQGAGVAA